MHGNRKTSNMNFEEDLKNSLSVLKQGGIIVYPTDTVWGIGCDATNNTAVEKIFRIKTRETSKSLIILVDGIGMLERYVKTIPQTASELTSVSDSPLTIIYPDGKNLAAGICGEDGSVGIRICNEPFCNELITRFRRPLVSTSANISGKPSPALFREITGEIFSQVDYVVKYRQNDRQKHSPSPVIQIDKNGALKILRQ
jgi:L-threonylcarbamoyladenylate synthase